MSFKLITPPGMLFTTALLVIYATYAFLIGSVEDSVPLLAGGLVAAVATYGTAMVRPWSRWLVYLITAGYIAKLGLSFWQAAESGYFDLRFDSTGAAIRSLLPSMTMALLGLVCCGLVWIEFGAKPLSSHGSTRT